MIQGREGSFSLEPRTKNGTRYGFVNFTTSEEAPLKRETFQDGTGTVSRRGFQSDTSHQQLPAWAVRVGLLGHYIGMGFKLENVPVLTCPHSPRLTVRFANNTKGHGTSPAGLIASEPDSTTAFARGKGKEGPLGGPGHGGPGGMATTSSLASASRLVCDNRRHLQAEDTQTIGQNILLLTRWWCRQRLHYEHAMPNVLYFAALQGLSATLTEDNIKTVFTNYGQARGMH